ncbi:hypothetical protein TrispH2_003120 [Trichoplax sp. H2]|nr:hypothetical protein TrispH2_003120 [Trichoplax sp. H2]|eukprot:RDD44464.1 hypothetical protein TrispH2_003120 [Trichoplax sp. H2]
MKYQAVFLFAMLFAFVSCDFTQDADENLDFDNDIRERFDQMNDNDDDFDNSQKSVEASLEDDFENGNDEDDKHNVIRVKSHYRRRFFDGKKSNAHFVPFFHIEYLFSGFSVVVFTVVVFSAAKSSTETGQIPVIRCLNMEQGNSLSNLYDQKCFPKSYIQCHSS